MTWILGPLGACPTPSFHKMLNILKTVQLPTCKPYIYSYSLWWGALSDMDHGSQRGPPGVCPPGAFYFIKCVISRKLFRSPPINHIYCCSLWQAVFIDMDPRVPRKHAPPALFIKCIISWKPFWSPHKPYIFLFWLSMALWKVQHFNIVSKISQKLFKPLSCNLSGW